MRSAGASKEELVRLRRRIEELENTVPKHSEPENVEEVGPESSTNIPKLQADEEQAADTPAMMGLAADRTGTASSHSRANNPYSNFRATSFVNQLMSAIDGPFAAVEPPLGQSRHGNTFINGAGSRKEEPKEYVLPPRSRADHLVGTYWRLVHTLYPCMDVNEFDTQYRKVWTGEDLGPDAITFICLLNIIFSQGCNFDVTVAPEMRAKNAAVFYERAQELLSLQSLRHPSLLTVQCYLLLGQYLQSTNDPQFCWIVVGTAIRLAQSLGLDLERPKTSEDFDHDYQVARCVWHGCVIMDGTLSTVFGRPPIISRREAMSVPLPAPHSNGRSCNCFAQICPSTEDQSCIHFFVESLKLFDLIGTHLDALDNLPKPHQQRLDGLPVWPTSCISPRALSAVLDMDKAMWAWAQGLPLYLQPQPNAEKSKTQLRQTNVLFLRHRFLRILLFRPILARVCHVSRGAEPPKTLENRLASDITLECAISCVRTALEVIDLFEDTLATHGLTELDEVLSSWWYNIFYLYSAATVLVAGRLHPLIEAAVSEEAIQHGAKSSLQSLSRFFSYSTHAAKSARVISLLFEKVAQQRIAMQNSERSRAGRHSHDSSQQQENDPFPGIRNTSAGKPPDEATQAEEAATRLAYGTDPTTNSNEQNWMGDDNYRRGWNDPDQFSNNFEVVAPGFLDFGDFGDMAWLTSFPPEANDFDVVAATTLGGNFSDLA